MMPYSLPSLPRRQVLGAAVGGSAVVGVGGSQIRIDPIVTWEPPPGTWPYHWYDSGKTGANPHASPPTDPEAVWQTAIPGEFSEGGGIVVGPDRVYASCSGQLTAINRQNGTVDWQTGRPAGVLVIHEGTLYHAPSEDDSERDLTALDANTGQPRWRTEDPDISPRAGRFLVTADTIFVGDRAYDIQYGSYKWSPDDGSQFIAGDGNLFGFGDRNIRKYRSRSALEVALGRPPTTEWTVEELAGSDGTVLQDDLLFRLQTQGRHEGDPAIVALDSASGERVWTALVPGDFATFADDSSGDGSEYVAHARPPAIGASRGIVGAEAWSWNSNTERVQAVIGFSTTDGSILWQRSLDQSLDFLNDVVVANDTVILAHGGRGFQPDTAAVQALDATTGRELWHVSTEYEPVQVAAVDRTIFVATEPDPNRDTKAVPNRVIALR